MAQRTGIVLFRKDLRLNDNPALAYACETCDAVVPLFVWSPEEPEPWAPGAASRYWLHQSLKSLASSLSGTESRLILAKGESVESVLKVTASCEESVVVWNRRYEPKAILADTHLKKELAAHGIDSTSFNGSLLAEPWEIKNKSGKPFRVFTPFWKSCLTSIVVNDSLDPPDHIPPPLTWPDTINLETLGLEPKVDWAGGIRETWNFGESGAESVLNEFLDERVATYKDARDQLGQPGTSCLSPYLAWGELSPRQVWNATRQRISVMSECEMGAEAFLRQLFWREFGYHLLYHDPATTDLPLRGEFRDFPWSHDENALERWQQGKTGYPVVDAAMNELWYTGYMHNRARMVVASFLVKDLLIPWLDGAKWFWDTLVDADLANNTLGWQWTAGCGADAAPYFRIFNPVRQGERFDPEGMYIRRWLPELSKLPNRYIHRPWEAPGDVLKDSDVKLDDNFPRPMVDHFEARDLALAAYESIRK
jgi:deoxyribodipyrimidine photo-lyase